MCVSNSGATSPKGAEILLFSTVAHTHAHTHFHSHMSLSLSLIIFLPFSLSSMAGILSSSLGSMRLVGLQ